MTPEELVVVLLVALIGSILGPVILEALKFLIEPKRKERKESEQRYFNMLQTLTGFYMGSLDKKQIDIFYEHYRLAWLYAPDEVIKSINKFLESVGGTQKEESEPEKATRKMIFEMRKAFKGKTELKPEDFLIIGVPEHKKTT